VLRAPEWVACHPDYGSDALPKPAGGPEKRFKPEHGAQLKCFLKQPEAASYPQFNAFTYSADTLLPIVAMEMQEFWIPDDSSPLGYWARWFLWFQIAMGWALSLLAVAGFSGLIKTDNTTQPR